MLEKIKEVPFIAESMAVKILSSAAGRTMLERNDRVIWGRERLELETTAIDCYVEANKFFPLLSEIAELSQGTCLTVKLKNGAKYDLPFLDVSWEPIEMPEEYDDTIMFKLGNLMLCTLKNLIKPELQCVLIDSAGAVTCDFISACISTEMTSTTQMLLPPDVQELVNNRICKVQIDEGKIYIEANDFVLVTPNPTIGEDSWWESLREMLNGAGTFVPTAKLAEGLKRLAMFDDYAKFDGRRVTAGSNFEPFMFTPMGDVLEGDAGLNKYEIEKLAKILTVTKEITKKGNNIIMRNDAAMFLVSPMEEA